MAPDQESAVSREAGYTINTHLEEVVLIVYWIAETVLVVSLPVVMPARMELANSDAWASGLDINSRSGVCGSSKVMTSSLGCGACGSDLRSNGLIVLCGVCGGRKVAGLLALLLLRIGV